MGWSCSKAAMDTLDRWLDVEKAHGDGFAHIGKEKYFTEVSNREYNDGAITGSILRDLPEKPGFCRKAGTFKINGDGSVARAPAFMRHVMEG